MKPETILQSDVLDIIFEGRNKDYGAYALRKNYDRRLIQSLGIMVLLAGTFLVLQNVNIAGNDRGGDIFSSDLEFVQVELPKQEIKEENIPQKPQQKAAPQATIDHTTFVIKEEVPETKVPSLEQIEGRVISTVTNILPPGDGGNVPVVENPSTGNNIITTPEEPEVKVPSILNHAEIMPSFNGDLVKYMLRHLRQPDDLEEGDRIVVKVKFVVNADGNITDVEVIQSGRSDLDAEVVRVVKKMPRWNPGQQGGRAVPVFFNMPVTFVSNP